MIYTHSITQATPQLHHKRHLPTRATWIWLDLLPKGHQSEEFGPEFPPVRVSVRANRDVNGKSEKTGRDLPPFDRLYNTTTPPQTPLAYTDHVDLARFGVQRPPKGRFGAKITKSPPFGVWLRTSRDVNGKSEETGRDLHPSDRPCNRTPYTPLAYTAHVAPGRFGLKKGDLSKITAI